LIILALITLSINFLFIYYNKIKYTPPKGEVYFLVAQVSSFRNNILEAG